MAAERLHSGFSGAAAALKAPLQRADSFSAAARRALRAAPQVKPCCLFWLLVPRTLSPLPPAT